MSALILEQESAPRWLREHWLSRCEGFRVERGGRPLGFVEAVDDVGGETESLVIASSRGRFRADVAEVVELDPSRCLVRLGQEP